MIFALAEKIKNATPAPSTAPTLAPAPAPAHTPAPSAAPSAAPASAPSTAYAPTLDDLTHYYDTERNMAIQEHLPLHYNSHYD